MNMFPICISLLSSLGLLNLFPLIQVPFREPRSLNIKIKLCKSNQSNWIEPHLTSHDLRKITPYFNV